MICVRSHIVFLLMQYESKVCLWKKLVVRITLSVCWRSIHGFSHWYCTSSPSRRCLEIGWSFTPSRGGAYDMPWCSVGIDPAARIIEYNKHPILSMLAHSIHVHVYMFNNEWHINVYVYYIANIFSTQWYMAKLSLHGLIEYIHCILTKYLKNNNYLWAHFTPYRCISYVYFN